MNKLNEWQDFNLAFGAAKAVIFIGLTVLAVLFLYGIARADVCSEASGYSCDQIVNAIYLSEGGSKTKYPYGIKSVSCAGHDACRKVCLNTVKNNVGRWRKAQATGDARDYLTFLWHRYCPPQAHDLNNNWLKNVKYFLKKEA